MAANILRFFLILLFASNVASAATLNVNYSTGNDSNTYSQVSAGTHQWQTLGRAVWGNASRASANSSEAAQAGDTVLVAAGTYNAAGSSGSGRFNVAYCPVNSGTSGSPITIQASGTVILQSTVSTGPVIGATAGINYIVWDGFYIDEDNVLTTSDTGPVTVSGATGTQLKNLEINGNQCSWNDNHNGIRLESAESTTIYNCKIYGIGDPGGYGQNSAAIMMYNSNNTTIKNNTLYSNGVGIYVKGITTGTQDGTIIWKNYIYDNGFTGITSEGSSNSVIKQNIIVRNSQANVWIKNSNDDNQNTKLVNNVLANCSSSRGEIQLTHDVAGDFTQPPYIYNNIFYSDNEIIYYDFGNGDGAPKNAYPEHNVYYNYSTFITSEGGWSLTFAQWKSVTGYDSATPESITENPLFTDISNNIYTLQVGSPASALGVDILDLDGDSSTVDNIPAGAYITGNETIGVESTTTVTARTAAGVTYSGAGFH